MSDAGLASLPLEATGAETAAVCWAVVDKHLGGTLMPDELAHALETLRGLVAEELAAGDRLAAMILLRECPECRLDLEAAVGELLGR